MSSNNFNERKALLSLVQHAWSTSLEGWSFDSEVPLCNWEGVTCGGNAVVKALDLSNQGLSGTIPSQLGLLADLEVLTLKSNILDGSIPQEIANLKKLVTLDLTDCFLTGTLPQRFESPKLTNLMLANNAISGRFFQNEDSPHLKSIKEIRLENNLLTGTLHGQTLVKMSRLETLSLSDNDLSGLIPGDELGSLPSLHYIYLDSNHFVGPLPTHLAQVGKASLLELWLQDNALSGTVPASYVRFDKLHDFFIDGNKLTGAVPPGLCGPEINSDFFQGLPDEAERNYCDSIACPAGSVAFEGVYPCEQCPGGEVARLKNRYLGQTGACSNYSERDVLKIFFKATTKGGLWKGVNDWTDEKKSICEMTGITCDAHGHVIRIALKNRGLEGHLPEEIGHLSFLESLDVSDNHLMGYVPRDLQWTAITKLDISGNKIRGMVPPLLCMMEELNGNGQDNIFYCDRIACPAGTFNSLGYHHGVNGVPCEPCYDETPFIGQKVCNNKKPSTFLQKAKETGEQVGISPAIGLGIVFGAFLIAMVTCLVVRRVRSNPRKKYEHGTVVDYWNQSGQNENDYETTSQYTDDGAYNNEEDGEGNLADSYLFSDDGNAQSHFKGTTRVYRDFSNSNRKENGETNMEDGYTSTGYDDVTRHTTLSATDLVSDHQGIALSRHENFEKAASVSMSGDTGRHEWEAATTVNVRPMQFSNRSSSSRSSRDVSKKQQPTDLLDVPIFA